MEFNDILKFDFKNLKYTDTELYKLENNAISAQNILKKKRQNKEIGFYDVIYNDTNKLLEEVKKYKKKFKRLIVLGIGGSALGSKSIIKCLEKYTDFEVLVFDNIDSDEFKKVLQFDPNETLYNIISKSGSTAETMCQFVVVYNYIKDKVKNVKDHFIFTTSKDKGDLCKISKDLEIPILIVPDNVGGRFSVFTNVGLFPISMAGIDIKELLKGTQIADSTINKVESLENPLIKHASLIYMLEKKFKKNISVFMLYSGILNLFGAWLVQLWAESLGKRFNIWHKEIFEGSMPISAIGARDQHSTVQLFKEGPNDKYFTFLNINKRDEILHIDYIKELSNYSSIRYLLGQNMNKLMLSEFLGTKLALTKNGRRNMTISISEISPETIGVLYYYFECLIPLIGVMYKINPFDQPGVEEGKHYAYALMGREGYEDIQV